MLHCRLHSVPFDDSNIVVYFAASIWVLMAIAMGGFAHMAINAMFIDVTYNCAAGLRDLGQHMRGIDADAYVPTFGRLDDDTTGAVRTKSTRRIIVTKLLRCQHFHKQLLQYNNSLWKPPFRFIRILLEQY